MSDFRMATSRWGGDDFGLIAGDRGLREVVLPHGWTPEHRSRFPEDRGYLAPYLNEFDDYWSGRLTRWSVPLDIVGTPFQKAVWRALMDIPYGTVVTYGAVAQAIGRPAAVRAVAAAVGKNPLSIIIPCHRVVGADNTLTGYGGGMALKERLLALEGVTHIKSKGHARFAF